MLNDSILFIQFSTASAVCHLADLFPPIFYNSKTNRKFKGPLYLYEIWFIDKTLNLSIEVKEKVIE